MSYVGSSAAVIPVGFSGVNSQSFNGDGSTVAFTLNRPVSAVNAIEVMVNNVQQSPYDGSYSVSSTTLTFSAAPSSGTANIYVVYRDFPVGSITDTGAVQKTGDTMTGNLIVDANVGIGTSSPDSKLHVLSTTLPQLKIDYNGTYYSTISNNGALNVVDPSTSNKWVFLRNGVEQMRIGADGGLSFANTSNPGPFNTVLGNRNNHFTGQRSNTVAGGTTSTMLTINFTLNGAAIVRVVDSGTVYTYNYFTNVYEYFVTCYNGTVTATLKQSQLGAGAGSFITTSTGSSTFNIIQTSDSGLATMHDTAVDILGVAAGNFNHATMTITMAASN